MIIHIKTNKTFKNTISLARKDDYKQW